MIGKTIHHYKILEELGSGGMGTVYKAQDTKLDRLVALKFLAPHLSRDENEKQRFIHEAKAISALDHPNICSIFEINETDDGQMYIAMACYQGKTLKDVIKEKQLNVNKALDIAVQIAEGLAVAHSKDIIHRDIKPANVLITEEGKVKVVDFGLAKLIGRTMLTKDGSTMGTTAYMSPEQVKGSGVDNRTDIWSFGVVLYEMLTGKLPFTGDYDQAIIYSILNEEPQLEKDIDSTLKKIIIKSLKKNREERYQMAGEIAEDLRIISQGGEVKRTKTKQSKLLWMVAGAAVILIAIALYLFMPTSKGAKTTETIKTIAVLPFANISSDPNQGYISDGLSEELISVLQKNPKLRVTARTSSFAFKGKGMDIKTIAAKLSVNNILEGSVQKAGDNLRISADLVNVKTDATLWSNTYDGTMVNIFALQDSISGNVAEALNAALLDTNATAPEQKTSPEAYNDFLLAEHFFNLLGKENLKKAEGYYEKALSIDSSYVPAWVRLAWLHLNQTGFGFLPADETVPKARKEIEKALELNPNSADAYVQLANIKWWDWDLTGVEEASRKALELEPENEYALLKEANLAVLLYKKYDEAIKLCHRAIEKDPLNLYAYYVLSLVTRKARLYDESIATMRKSLELNPRFLLAHTIIGLDYLSKGKPDSALAEFQKNTDAKFQAFGLALAYYALGKKKESDDKLAELIKKFPDIFAYKIAVVYAYRNEKDKAFEWLERSYNEHDPNIMGLKFDRMLHNIRKDPRYAALMKKMKLPL